MYTITQKIARLAGPLLLLGCTVCLVLVCVRSIMLPMVVSTLHNRIDNLQRTVQLEQVSHIDTLMARSSLQQTLLTTKWQRLSTGLNGTGDLSKLLEVLISRANTADIQFVKMAPQAQSIIGDRILYPVLLEMTTGYHSLGTFISSLESLPLIVRIDRIALQVKDQNVCDVKILVTCFLWQGVDQ